MSIHSSLCCAALLLSCAGALHAEDAPAPLRVTPLPPAGLSKVLTLAAGDRHHPVRFVQCDASMNDASGQYFNLVDYVQLGSKSGAHFDLPRAVRSSLSHAGIYRVELACSGAAGTVFSAEFEVAVPAFGAARKTQLDPDQ